MYLCGVPCDVPFAVNSSGLHITGTAHLASEAAEVLSVRLGLGEMRTLCRCLLRQDSEQGGAALCKVALTRTFARPQPEH
jgi:hypothetical protein